MAGYSALPAMDINPVGFGAANSLAMSQAQTAQQNVQQQSALAPIALKEAQQKSDLQSMDTANSTLAQVAKDAQAADPDEAPSVWDEGMKAAVAKGVGTANQYIGHYRPDLAERVGDVYGGQKPSAPPGFDADQVARAMQQATPDVRQKAVKNWTAITSGFDRVRNEDDWNNEMQTLRQTGIPVDQFLPQGVNWQRQYAAVKPLVDRLRAALPYAQQAVASDAMGLPQMTAPIPLTKITAGESLVDPTGRVVTTAPDKKQYVGMDKTGGAAQVFDPITGSVITPMVGAQSAGGPGDPFMGFAQGMNKIENGTGNPGAQNPNSSATGNGQFIKATWLQQARRLMPDQTNGLSDDQVLAMRNDPAASLQMTAGYARENASVLLNAGMPVTTGTLALAHRLGPDGALKVLYASANTPLANILRANVIAANPDMKGQTAGTYANGIIQQMGNQPVLSESGGSASVPGNGSLHGDDYLKSIPDQSIASQVKAYAEGRIQQPSSFFMKTPYGQMMMRAIAQYEPGFDLTLYNSRAAANKDLATGKMGQNVTSFNTAIGHLGVLDDSINRLENGSFPLINSAVNTWRNQTGDPRVQQFNVARDAVAAELTRAFRGTGGTGSEVDAWQKTLGDANSPEQLHGAVKQAVDLLESRINATNDQYSRAMRMKVDPGQLLSPNARATLARLGGQSTGGSRAAPAVGTVVRGYAFKGGNPADQNSWAKVQ